jgi:hypothetical protein
MESEQAEACTVETRATACGAYEDRREVGTRAEKSIGIALEQFRNE